MENVDTSPEAIAANTLQVATTGDGELDVSTMRKYVQYCKAKCAPRLSEESGEILTSSYVKIRDDVSRCAMKSLAQHNNDGEGGGDDQAVIPITVRQLEALVRLRLQEDVQTRAFIQTKNHKR